MITEDYINFETAKLLKEKGFDESVTHYYFTQITHVGFKDYPTGVLYTDSDPQHQNNYKNKVAAPTQALVMKWLRLEHNIHIEPHLVKTKHSYGYMPNYIDISCLKQGFPFKEFDFANADKYVNSTYSQACEVTIKYCLENLI